jgi:hypothetical protein
MNRAAGWMSLFESPADPVGGPGLAREVEQLSLACARFLTGTSHRDALVRVMGAAHPAAFWAALEAFTENIAGDEWKLISRELLELRPVEHERRRLRHPWAWRRALAARHLGLLDAHGMRGPLRAAMARGPALVTFSAALALARLQDRRALRWLLDHPDALARRGRQQLVALLKRFGEDSVGDLRAAIEGWEIESPIHIAAVEVVGLRRDAASRARLEQLLATGGPEARVAAARSLGNLGHRRAVPALLAALDAEAWELRAQAARSLGMLGDESAVPGLAPRLRDTSWWVRRNAAYALALLGAPGRAALESITAQTQDVFAAEMAEEVLQLMDWDLESPGGISRVA